MQVWTNLTTVLLVKGNIRKFGLELRIEKTMVATQIWRQTFLENCKKKHTFQLIFFKHNQESEVCFKKVDLFQFKMDWFKIKAGRNLGPRNYMYLSVLGCLYKILPKLKSLCHVSSSVTFEGVWELVP